MNFHVKSIENQCKSMIFHDFPRFLGKSGVYLIHPPELCAGLAHLAAGLGADRAQVRGEGRERRRREGQLHRHQPRGEARPATNAESESQNGSPDHQTLLIHYFEL